MKTLQQLLTLFNSAKSSLADLMESFVNGENGISRPLDPRTEERIELAYLVRKNLEYLFAQDNPDLQLIFTRLNLMISYIGDITSANQIYNSYTRGSGMIFPPGITNLQYASNTVYGITRLTAAPAVANQPIAVGANDSRIAQWMLAYDRSIVGVSVDSDGNIVLTKQDGNTLASTEAVVLGQTASQQNVGFWIGGNGRIDGTLRLNLSDPSAQPNVVVADANGILYKRTLAEFANDISIGGFTANRAIISNGSGVLVSATTTATEIGYVNGVTSPIQTQLNNKQPLDADLTAIAALGFTSTAFLKKTGANTWALDTNTYITGNQPITLSGDVTGNGTTAIVTAIANDAVTFAKMQNVNSGVILGRTSASVGNIEQLTVGTGLLLSGGVLSSTITQYTDAMARASISNTVTGIDYNSTSGVFSTTSGYGIPTTANQALWTTAYNNMIVSMSFDTSNGNLTLTQQDAGTIVQDLDGRYLIANQTITLSGDVTGSGTTSIATTIANDAVTFAKMQNISSGVVLGRSTAGSGDVQEITIGTGLVLSSGTLSLGTLTANRALVTGVSGAIEASATTATQIGYLSTLTSNVQTQIDGKQPLDATLTALAAIGNTSIGFVVLNGVDSFATRVLEGTANRITINNANGSASNPAIDIASTYAGQSSITTLGTITNGVWNASPIADGYITSAANWNEAYDQKVNSITWSTSTGNLVLINEEGSNPTVNLDGRYVKLSGDTMTGYLTLVGNPINANHAANKAYVDSIGTGISPKGGATAATTGTLPTYIPTSTTLTGSVAGALPSQDGVTLVANDILLVKNEISNQYNGLYVVTDPGDGSNPYVLTRTSNSNTWDELVRATVFISEGTTQAGYTYYCTVATGGTLGTTPVTYELFSIGSVYLAGSGIDITGNTISIASNSIVNSMISSSAAIALNKLASTTASKALVSDASGYITASTTTSTEIGYVSGVTSALQTQLNNKQPLDATLTALAAYNTNGFMVQTAADTFTGRTLQGQTNRIDITNGSGVSGNPIIDISATYVGQNTITTLGTIATGVWQGTAIADTYISSSANWNSAYNNTIVSASFGTGDGILTLTQQDTGSVTVDLDGRYALGGSIAGTPGTIAKFNGSGDGVVDSLLSESGGNVSVNGLFKFKTGSGYSLEATGDVGSYYSSGTLFLFNNLGTIQFGTDTNGNALTLAGNGAATFSSSVTASSIIKSGGTSAQFLKADGSVDSNTYLTANQTITLSGEASGSGSTSISVTLGTTAVTGKLLTGYVSGAGTITASDSILSAIQKLNGNIAGLVTGVSSVSGTSNRISVSSTTGAVVVDISATYAGQNTITTLGTIGTGVWQGSAIADTYISSASTWNAKIGGSGTTNYVSKFTASGTIGDSLIFDNGTNVGIGTSSLVAKLQVKTATDKNLGVLSATTETAGVKLSAFNDAANAGIPFELNGSILLFKIGEVEAARFSASNRNLLINTTTDDGVNKLQVSGSASFTSSVTANSFIKSGGTSAQFLKADGSVDSNTYLTTAAAAAAYQPLDATLTALAGYNTNGILTQTAADTFVGRTITAGTGISVTNGSGVSGNPTIALDTSLSTASAILNQNASAQTANFWITGDAKVNSKVYIGNNGAFIEEALVSGVYKLRVTDSAGNTTVL